MVRLQQSRHVLGSDAVLTLVGKNDQTLQDLFASLWHEIGLFEQTFSRFITDSELSSVNAQAGLPVSVSPEFIQLCRKAIELANVTDGLYNPFVLPALQRAGYKGSWPSPEKVDPQLDYSSRAVSSVDALLITEDTIAIPAGSALDFGGIGKGYLLDALADMLQASGCDNFWLSLGGDIVACGLDANGEPWQLGIAAAETDAPAASVTTGAKRLALATSGTIKRRGPGWHHLIDPRTGAPAKTDVLTATVCATSATDADVFAKCLVLLGSEHAQAFKKKHGITEWMLQTRDVYDKIQTVKQGM